VIVQPQEWETVAAVLAAQAEKVENFKSAAEAYSAGRILGT
jgi:hypothetical protein